MPAAESSEPMHRLLEAARLSTAPRTELRGDVAANWPATILHHDAWLIAMANVLAHELMHNIDYLVGTCEHDPAEVPTVYADAVPWDAMLSDETTFSEHVRSCFQRGVCDGGCGPTPPAIIKGVSP